MKRIGVTQRVSTQFHGQPHDCLDQAWSELLGGMGYEIAPLPNLAASDCVIAAYLDRLHLDALILSGGNDVAGLSEGAGAQASPRRDAFERAAIAWARGLRLPLLGVCRGMQFLNVTLGGSLLRVEGHAGARHELTRAPVILPRHLDALPDRFEVNSFHNFAVSQVGLAPALKAAAFDSEGLIEAFFHPHEPLTAMMWHPEREIPFSEIDLQILSDCLEIDLA